MSCRTGCKTQDHASYALCLREAGPRVAYTNSTNGWDYTRQKSWDNELSRYRDITAQGLNPHGTTHRDMDKAEKAAEIATSIV